MNITHATSLVPGPQKIARLKELLDRRARLSEELAGCEDEIARETPPGFGKGQSVCCGSPVVGYLAWPSTDADSPTAYGIQTATLKAPSGCCSLAEGDYPTRDAANEAAWSMNKANGLGWDEEGGE